MPRVLGTVSIIPAVLGVSFALTDSIVTWPLSFEGTLTTSNPAMAALAGLVPCAVSATSISVLSPLPLSRRYFLIMRTPANSPCAPAAVLSANRFIPEISQSISESSWNTWSSPWTVESCWSG